MGKASILHVQIIFGFRTITHCLYLSDWQMLADVWHCWRLAEQLLSTRFYRS